MKGNSVETIGSAPATRVAWFAVQVLWFLGWFALVLVLVLGVVVTTTELNVKYMRLPVEVSYEGSEFGVLEGQELAALPVVGFRELLVDARYTARVQKYLLLMPGFLILFYVWIVWQLRRVFRTVRSGRPFSPENPRRIRSIGWAVLVSGPLYGLMSFAYGKAFIPLLEIPDATVSADMSAFPVTIFFGLIILVLAHVFELGARLKEDQDLTV